MLSFLLMKPKGEIASVANDQIHVCTVSDLSLSLSLSLYIYIIIIITKIALNIYENLSS